MNGALVIDKPAGMTSHDVVARVRHVTGERSVGHLGTLDPMATGVLPLLLGRYTRLAQFFGDSEKAYEGVILLGIATDTYDADGEFVGEARPVDVSTADVEGVMEQLRGEIEQVPPSFSAKKVKGVSAYKLARKSEQVELKPVKVTVHEFVITALEDERLHFRARVSSGTYVRSLAHDLGRLLGVGAHLAELRRTRSGEFTLDQAIGVEQMEQSQRTGGLDQIAIGAHNLLRDIPSITATEEQLTRIRHGNAVNLSDFSSSKYVKVFAGRDELAAMAVRVAGTLFQPKIVLLESAAIANVR